MNVSQAGIERTQCGWGKKETSEAEKMILGIQARDRGRVRSCQRKNLMSSWKWNEGEANEKAPKSSGLSGGNAHNDTKGGGCCVCAKRG